MYGGNPFFTGNVQFEHQGAMLTADRVIFTNENFKAIGNVLFVTSDGNRIIPQTRMEYDGNTQRGIARGKVVLTGCKNKPFHTDVLYYDRVNKYRLFQFWGNH